MKLPSFLHIRIPINEKYKHEYDLISMESNLRVVHIISSILLVFHLIMLAVDYFLYASGKWDEVIGYKYLFYSHLLVYLIFLPVCLFSKKGKNAPLLIQKSIVHISTVLTITWATIVSMIDQFIHQNITVIMICVLIISTMIILNLKERILVFSFALLIFFFGFLCLYNDSAIKIANIINGSIFIIFAFVISTLMSNYHFRSFSSLKLIEEQNDKLVSYNEDLKQFSYIVSHDLKAPLRTISSFTALLDKSFHDKTKRQAEFMHFIKDGAKNMSHLIDDLLTFTSLEKNAEMKTLDLDNILTLVKNNLSAEINETNTIIEQPQRFPKIKGIKPHLILLFQNLISNAIKYNDDNSPIIHIAYLRKKDEIEFVIKDNGIGIDNDTSSGIFNLFSRGEQDESKFKGTGIGLAICKKIVQHMNGRIWVVSDKGDGSSFFFTIPIAVF